MKNGKVFVDIVYCIFFSVLLTENFTELFHLSKKREEKLRLHLDEKHTTQCVNLNNIANKRHCREVIIFGIYFLLNALHISH